MTPRTPLAPIAHNRRRNTEIPHGEKQRLWRRACAGQGATEIASNEGLSKWTVKHALERVAKRNSFDNLPRSGRPVTYTVRDARCVVRIARKEPKYTYEQLRKASSTNLSAKVLRTILHDHGIINWCCKRRLHLTEEHNLDLAS